MRITDLVVQATDSAEFRGHTLTWTIEGGRAVGTCLVCGMRVHCTTHPAPNDIDIGGEAVALNCQKKEG